MPLEFRDLMVRFGKLSPRICKARSVMAGLFEMGAFGCDLLAQDLNAFIPVPDIMTLPVAFAAEPDILSA